MKKFFVSVAGLLSFSIPAAALDGQALAVHLRKTLSLDTRTEIKVASVTSSAGIGNLKVVTVSVGGAPYPVFLSPDEKQYIWGFMAETDVDPDKTREKQISLKNVHSQGSASAPVTVVEYSDLQCGHCKVAHAAIKDQLFKVFTKDQVRFVSKSFPLNGHDWAEPAAVVAECASEQKPVAYWDMEDFFFANQEKINKDNFKQFRDQAIKDQKLDAAKIDACVAAGAALARVQAEKKEGGVVGVASTPSFFVNGRSRRGFRDIDDIKVVVDEKLKEISKR